MNKKLIKIISIISVILIIIIILISIFISSFKKDYKETLKIMEQIKEEYQKFSISIDTFLDHRSSFYNLKNNIYLEDMANKKEQLVLTMTNYQKVINNIDTNSKFLQENCKIKYSDKSVNNTCDVFKQEYEASMNYYITDVKVYNNFIKNYNEWVKNNNLQAEVLTEIELTLYKKYIDYDKDGSYLGGSSSEENK